MNAHRNVLGWAWLLRLLLLSGPFGVQGSDKSSNEQEHARIQGSGGLGPIAVHPLDARFVLVTDKQINQVLIVDVDQGGRVVARREWDAGWKKGYYDHADGSTWSAPVGLATCPTCTFVWFTSNWHPYLMRMDSARPLTELLSSQHRSRDLQTALNQSKLVPCTNATANFLSTQQPRMLAINEKGTRAYLATHKGNAVYWFDPRATEPQLRKLTSQVEATSVALWPAMRPTGKTVPREHRPDEVLIVSGEQQPIVLVDALTGRRLASLGSCKSSKWGHGRDARVDPFTGKMLYLCHPSKKGALLAELSAEPGDASCRALAGNSNVGTGWRDGRRSEAHFSRPHGMAVLPPPGKALVLTDIDSAALRLVRLWPPKRRGEVSTLLYNDANPGLEGKTWHIKDPSTPQNASQGFSGDQGVTKCAQKRLRLCAPAELTRYASQKSMPESWSSRRCDGCWTSSSAFKSPRYRPGRCSNPSVAASPTLNHLPVFSTDNTKNPGAWASGRATVQVDKKGVVTVRCLADDGTRRFPVVCCDEDGRVVWGNQGQPKEAAG